MRFGGHETFSIREGWLHKGLKLLVEDPDKMMDEFSADWLGVGKNMAKSIRHWLVATELADRKIEKRKARLEVSEFGKLIYEEDLFFTEIGTWWALHINLVNNHENAYSWSWFFNHFTQSRFERSGCIDSLSRHLKMAEARIPSPRTIERDLACLLHSYARIIPVSNEDPEEARECPLVDLGLMTHFGASGYFQLHQGQKFIPSHLLGYSLSKVFEEIWTPDAPTFAIPVKEAAQKYGGPGRAFVLTSEALFDLVLKAEEEGYGMEVSGLAGDRRISIRKMPPLDWLREYFQSIKRRESNAA
jgi:hypothetical protein